MDIVTEIKQKNKRYLPHELTTRINSVKLYRQTKDIDFVLRRYHISKASLMRWNKLYDGTKESFTASNERFKRNGYKVAKADFSWWRPRRYVVMNHARRFGNICQAFGWSAWMAPFKERQS